MWNSTENHYEDNLWHGVMTILVTPLIKFGKEKFLFGLELKESKLHIEWKLEINASNYVKIKIDY